MEFVTSPWLNFAVISDFYLYVIYKDKLQFMWAKYLLMDVLYSACSYSFPYLLIRHVKWQ